MQQWQTGDGGNGDSCTGGTLSKAWACTIDHVQSRTMYVPCTSLHVRELVEGLGGLAAD